jgi:hypothetical protein
MALVDDEFVYDEEEVADLVISTSGSKGSCEARFNVAAGCQSNKSPLGSELRLSKGV